VLHGCCFNHRLHPEWSPEAGGPNNNYNNSRCQDANLPNVLTFAELIVGRLAVKVISCALLVFPQAVNSSVSGNTESRFGIRFSKL
jgi:hypothetical protein